MVGEIAIIVHTGQFHELLGTECEIIGPLEMRWAYELIDGIEEENVKPRYAVRCMDSKTYHVSAWKLRRKRPPAQFEAARWSDCAWQPTGVKA